MGFNYHSPGELQALGEKIRAKAIQVTMDQAASYAQAQQAANNDATRSDTGQLPQVAGYSTPADGRPDDAGHLSAYVSQAYAGIPDLFAAFALPNLDDSRPMLDALYAAAATVQVDLQLTARDNSVATPDAVHPIDGTAQVAEVVDLINGHMKSWTGAAARNFDQYLTSHVRAAALQRQITLSLALGLETQLEINRRINTDIWEIGQKTYKALDGLDAWCPGANASNTVALLTITGMQNAMTQLTKSIDTQQQGLAGALTSFAQDVSANWKRITVPAPEALNALSTADSTALRTPQGIFVN